MISISRRRLFSVLGAAAFALPGVLSVGWSQPTLAQQTLRISSGFGDAHSTTRAMREAFAPLVQEGTQGRYEVQIFPNNDLGPAQEMVLQTKAGTIFGLYISSAYFNAEVQELGVTNLPFVFPTREAAFHVLDGPIGQELAVKFEAKGFEVLGYFELGFRHVTNSRGPIMSPEDLRGMKIRLQPNPVHMATFRALGANPVAIDASELFASLRQKVVDGQENPFAVINIYKMYEAAQMFVSDTGHFYDIIVFGVSKNNFERMSPADQRAVREAAQKTVALQREIAASEDAMHMEALREKGVTVTLLTPAQREAFRVATQPVYEEMRGKLGAELIDRFLKAVEAASM